MEITTVHQPVKLEIELCADDIRTFQAVTHNLPSQYDFRVLVGCNAELSRKYLRLIEKIGMAVGGKSRENADEEVRQRRSF
ncbi:hypothetical protein [Amphritea sp. HPY]|uniref:hypothetical protein n=1 Tax=Amphritea sp. HPY TaxID=3421652 RepID=UPI003D7F0488